MPTHEQTAQPDTFRFDPDAKRRHITNEQIIDGLRRFARRRRGKRFLQQEFLAWKDRGFCPALAARRFGSWHAALIAAGLPGALGRRFTAAELMDFLEKLWRRLGQPPTGRDTKGAGIGDAAFSRRWGSLPNARRRLADFKNGKISREELLTPLALARAKRDSMAPSRRLAILRRDGHRCTICGQGAAQGAVLEVDHIVSVSAGGTDDPRNLRTLCMACNRGKGAKAA